MQGVRDQLHAAARMGSLPHKTNFKEEDTADVFWEILVTDVKLALKWALDTMHKKHCATKLSFSVSKESYQLDRA